MRSAVVSRRSPRRAPRFVAGCLVVQLLAPAPAARAASTDASTLPTARKPAATGGAGGASSASADPFTGAATFALALDLPPGTGGATPEIALRYSSHARGASWVGTGWSLGLPAIRRSLASGTPTYDDARDVFELAGERLVPESASPARPRVFRTLRDRFVRVVHEANGSWTVTSPDGTALRFGLSPNARIARPDGAVFEWLLQQQEDTHGNVAVAAYDRRDPGTAYLQTLRYTLRRPAGGGALESLGNDPSRDRRVAFLLEPAPRSDVVESRRAGFLSRVAHRLDFVDVHAAGALVRRYDLSYATSPDTARSLLAAVAHYGSDGYAASPTPPFVTRFAYHSNVASGTAGFERIAWSWPAGLALVSASRRDEGVRLADVDGDGRPDLVKALAVASGVDPKTATFALSADSGVYLNTGSGFASAPSARHALPSFAGGAGTLPFSLAWRQGGAFHTSGFDLADVTGDGRADLVGGVRDLDPVSGERALLGMPSWYVGTPDGFAAVADAGGVLAEDGWGFNRSGVVDVTLFTPTYGTTSGNARLADLTGDGLPELLIRSVEYKERATGGPAPWFQSWGHTCLHERVSHYYFENLGDGVFERAPVGDAPGPFCQSSLRRIAADFQHCDLAAPFAQCGYRVLYNETHPYRFEGDPWLGSFPWYWLTNLELGVADLDLDGDGLADTVAATSDPYSGGYGTASTAWLNDGARGYTEQPAWSLPEGVVLYELADYHSIDQGVRFADLNGDGRTDLVRAKAGAPSAAWLNDGDVDEAAPTPWVPTSAWPLPAGLVFADEQGRDGGVRLTDLDGDGMTDVVRSFGDTHEVFRNRGRTPDLLVRVTSPLGAETRIAYEPSSAHDVHGGDATPDLPFATPVVASVTTSPQPGDPGDRPETFTYDYAGGRWDAASRELRGFAMVVETRSDGRRVERRYAQDDARAGSLLSERTLDAQGRPFLELRYEYLPDPTPPYAALPSRIDRLEHDGAATPRRLRTEIRYGPNDLPYGAPSAVVEYGEVSEGGVDLVPGDTRTTELSYARNAALHLVDRVAVRRVRGADGAVVRETRSFYDGDTTGAAPPLRGDLTQRVEVLGQPGRPDPTTSFAYDAYGNPTRVTSPRANAGQGGGATSIEYDPLLQTFPVAFVNALGHRRELDYATAPGCAIAHSLAAGLVGRERGPNDLAAGTSWRRCYDAFGRIVREVAPADLAETTWLRSDAPLAAFVRESRRASATGWRVATQRLDGAGRALRVEQSGPAGATLVATRRWDAHGRLEVETAFGEGVPGPATTHRYDVLDREVATELPGSGRVREVRWDRGVVARIDPLGAVVRRVHDGHGRVVRVEEEAGGSVWATAYGYEPAGGLVSITDHHGNRTAIELDRLGRRTRLEDPDVGVATFVLDAEGNAIEQRSGEEVVTWSYDALGRPLQQTATSSRGRRGVAISWRWDAAQHGIGLLAARTDDGQQTYRVRGYDLLGRLERTGYVRAQGGSRLAFEFRSSWDPLGQPLTRRHPSGQYVIWERDALGFATAVRTEGRGVDASAIEWTPEGRLERWTAPGGVVHERRFDDTTRRLAAIRVARAGEDPIVSRQYAYDRADRVVRIDDAADWSRSIQLGYDAQSRLASVTRYEGGAWVVRRNDYDAIGNLLCRDALGPGCAGGTRLVYPSDAAGRARSHQASAIGGLPVTWASGGQTVAIGERRFAYDALGRLSEAWLGTARTLAADSAADGRTHRVWSADGGGEELTPEPDFEWLAASNQARVHVVLDGHRVATHTVPFVPPSSPSSCAGAPIPGAPVSPADLAALFGPGVAALLLLGARRRLASLPPHRRWDGLVAMGTGVAVVVVVSAPAPVRRAGDAIAQPLVPQSVYGHADHLGSVLAVTTASGAVLGAPVSYEPWGRLAPGDALATRFGFHGNRAAAGLYDYGVRWYDPSIGRFLQPDPVIADPLDPQQLSPYAYVRNDPVNRVDPTGAWSLSVNAWAGQVDEFGFTGVTAGASFGGGGYFSASAGLTVRGLRTAQLRYASFVSDALGIVSKMGAFQLFNRIGTFFKRSEVTPELPSVDAGPAEPKWRSAANLEVLSGLDPYVANLAASHLNAMEKAGLDARLGWGYRTYADQEALYDKGRTKPGDIVTNARGGESWHNFRLAYDVLLFDQRRYIKDGGDPRYQQAGELGEAAGLEWGGRWRNPDVSHFQFTGGLSLKTVRDRWERNEYVFP